MVCAVDVEALDEAVWVGPLAVVREERLMVMTVVWLTGVCKPVDASRLERMVTPVVGGTMLLVLLRVKKGTEVVDGTGREETDLLVGDVAAIEDDLDDKKMELPVIVVVGEVEEDTASGCVPLPIDTLELD